MTLLLTVLLFTQLSPDEAVRRAVSVATAPRQIADALMAQYAAVRERAMRERLPMYVLWGADWCGPCKRVRPLIEQRYAITGRYIYLDRDQVREFGTREKIEYVPTLTVWMPLRDGSWHRYDYVGEARIRQYLDTRSLIPQASPGDEQRSPMVIRCCR